MTDQNDSTKAGPMERRLQSREVAIACGVHIKTLGLWRRIPGRGPEPFHMVSSRCYVYPESAVERWLAAREGLLAPPAFPHTNDSDQRDAEFGVAPMTDEQIGEIGQFDGSDDEGSGDYGPDGDDFGM